MLEQNGNKSSPGDGASPFSRLSTVPPAGGAPSSAVVAVRAGLG
jgi:hypothetical protein